MACNSCSKTFSLLRKEKGCPACGFSYCSSCLKHKLFVPKLNTEAKVCAKCVRDDKPSKNTKIEPPDAYYKRIGATDSGSQIDSATYPRNAGNGNTKDEEIADRLKNLKEDTLKSKQITNEDIANRLQKIKGETPSTSDHELRLRLANIRGVPVSTIESKPVAIVPDTRTEQEQVEDLMRQYMAQAKIDGNYQEEFQGLIDDIQTRLHKLKNQEGSGSKSDTKLSEVNVESEDEDTVVNKIIEKAKAESRLESEFSESSLDELPFCEICNEDAKMRCLGCRYLYCKRCFMEHKDDEDGCNKYELYTPKNVNNP